jgi:general stress protein 13
MNYHINDVIYVTIVSVTPYGAFVNAEGGYTGLIHISEITGKFIKDISKYFKIGNIVEVTIIGIDEEKKQLSLSTKGIMPVDDIQNELLEDEIGFENLIDKLPEWINKTKNEIENSDI